MAKDPYEHQLLDQSMPCSRKTPVIGRLVCILRARADRRGLQLASFPSRVVQQNEIHELILTLQMDAQPGSTVDEIAYIGFFEIVAGGVLWSGDQVRIAGQPCGILAGYDLTHHPNHFNILLKTTGPLLTGEESKFQLGDLVEFIFPENLPDGGES